MSDSLLRTAAAEVLGRKAADTAFALLEEASAPPPNGEEPAAVVDAPQPTYELLETYDHPRYLEQTLSSKRRLIIVSPWIKRRVVNDAFVGQLRDLLRRGTDVYIGFARQRRRRQRRPGCDPRAPAPRRLAPQPDVSTSG